MPSDTLKKLQQEIESTQAANDEQAASIADLQNHVQRAIDEPEHEQNIVDTLRHNLALFRAEHPKLAAAIQAAVDFLAESGV